MSRCDPNGSFAWLQNLRFDTPTIPPCQDTVSYEGKCFQRYSLWYFLFGEAGALCHKDFPDSYPNPILVLQSGLKFRADFALAGNPDSYQQIQDKVAVARHFYDGSPLANQQGICEASRETPKTMVDPKNWNWDGVK